MNRFQKDIEILHDLLELQQERANAYQAIARLNDQEEAICRFLRLVAVQCRNAFLELRRHMDMSYGDPADRVAFSGDIYREWPGIKPFVPGSTVAEIIDAIEWNEIKAAAAYQKALTSGDALSKELQSVLYNQLRDIRLSFAFIQECREKPTAPPMETRTDAPPHFIIEEISVR
jgi:uncharacterized protein (TIGR02284 family)